MTEAVTSSAIAWRSGQLRDVGWFLSVVAASTLLVLSLNATLVPGMAAPFWDWPSAVVLLPLIPLLAIGAVLYRRLVHRAPYRKAWAEARKHELKGDRLLSLAAVIVATRFLMLNAVAWKSSIPRLHPFWADPTLARIDGAIHGGDAWALLPMHPLWLRALDAFYINWFLAFLVVVLWWGWESHPDRARRLVSIAFIWVIGSIAGVALSSAGPVYYQAVTGDPRFTELTSHLAAVPLAATALQRQLWAAHAGVDTGVIKGIAAMPSIHVAMPALYAVASRGKLRRFWWTFCALTLVGSVSLGWHYAIDGYVAIAGVAGIWWATGKLLPMPRDG